MRIDKWLWAVRVFKTRSQAAAACAAGHVQVNGRPVKASKRVQPGELISADNGVLVRTVRVVGLLEQRIGAPRVPEFLEDLTPASEYSKPREPTPAPGWMRGRGRPTKRDRRAIDRLGI